MLKQGQWLESVLLRGMNKWTAEEATESLRGAFRHFARTKVEELKRDPLVSILMGEVGG